MDFPIFGVIEKTPVILDGAMGTRLMNAGIAPGEAPERVNIDHPEVVENIHREYFNAGADVVITNTFGANVVKLKSKGLADQAGAHGTVSETPGRPDA
ncbi:MAG: homocysteine S-methyltransferase family protein [Deltaproteobacteria bacterium]|nr:homocysteine S-methyltransferase family protein [Deltaproteobacteria bacterium]